MNGPAINSVNCCGSTKKLLRSVWPFIYGFFCVQ